MPERLFKRKCTCRKDFAYRFLADTAYSTAVSGICKSCGTRADLPLFPYCLLTAFYYHFASFVFCDVFFAFADKQYTFFRMFSLYLQHCIFHCKLLYHYISRYTDPGIRSDHHGDCHERCRQLSVFP